MLLSELILTQRDRLPSNITGLCVTKNCTDSIQLLKELQGRVDFLKRGEGRGVFSGGAEKSGRVAVGKVTRILFSI